MTATRLSAISQVVLSVRVRMLSSAPRYSLPNESNYETIYPPRSTDPDDPSMSTPNDQDPSSPAPAIAPNTPTSTANTPENTHPPHHALNFTSLPRRVRCFNCGQMGHISYDCNQPQVRKACYVCGNPGHLSRDCPKNVRALYCSACGQTGHLANSCPQNKAME